MLPSCSRCCPSERAPGGGARLWGLGQSQELSSNLAKAGTSRSSLAAARWGWLEKGLFLARFPILILSFLPAALSHLPGDVAALGTGDVETSALRPRRPRSPVPAGRRGPASAAGTQTIN